MAEIKKEKTNKRDDIEEKGKEIAAERERIEAALRDSEEALKGTRRDLDVLHRNVEIVNRAYKWLDRAAWLAPIGTLVAYYATYILLSLPFNGLALDGIATAIIVAFVTRLVVFVAIAQLRGSNTSLTTSLRNAFLGIRSHPINITFRSSLDNSVSTAVGIFTKRVIASVRSYVPGADEYYQGKERIRSQKVFIRTLRNSLVYYGFTVGDKLANHLDTFVSNSDSIDDWLQETTNDLSTRYDLPSVIFKLTYADYSDDEPSRKNEWRSLRDDKSTFQKLVTHLILKNQLDIPTTYLEPITSVSEFVSNRLFLLDEFELSNARTAVANSFAHLESEKQDLLRTLGANNIRIDEGDREEFTRFAPIGDSLGKLLPMLEKFTGVKEDVLRLLFHDFRAQPRIRDDYFSEMKKDVNKISSLSRELLTRKIVLMPVRDEIQREGDISNLTSYLVEAPRYEKAEIGFVFSRYSQLFDHAKLLAEFLAVQKLLRREAAVTFEMLLKEKFGAEADFLSQLQNFAEYLIKEYSPDKYGEEWIKPVSQASITVFLAGSEDMRLRMSICQRVSGVTQTVKILYEYSWTNYDERDKISADKTTLDTIISRVINSTTRSETFLAEFTRALGRGEFYTQIDSIPETKLRRIEQQMALVTNQMDFKIRLEKQLSALRTVLETRLDTGTIMESLKMQLVGAYTITVPTGADILTKVIDDLLPETCKELAEKDERYKGLFLATEAGEVSVGRHTRIGVVPFKMEFKDFANLLENAYRIVVNKYQLSGRMGHPIEKYVANVIRIFPTSTYFRQLAPIQNREPEAILADILRPLMMEKFGNVKSLEIIASLRNPDEDKVAMKNVLANLYDTSGKIYGIATKEFDETFSIHPSPTILTEYVRSGKLDSDLISLFNKQKLSELAINLYETGKKQMEEVKSNLQRTVFQACNAIGARFSKEEIEKVSAIVFDALYEVGMILDVL